MQQLCTSSNKHHRSKTPSIFLDVFTIFGLKLTTSFATLLSTDLVCEERLGPSVQAGAGLWKVFRKLFHKTKPVTYCGISSSSLKYSTGFSVFFLAGERKCRAVLTGPRWLAVLLISWVFWNSLRPFCDAWAGWVTCYTETLASKLASCHITDFMLTDVSRYGRHKWVSQTAC